MEIGSHHARGGHSSRRDEVGDYGDDSHRECAGDSREVEGDDGGRSTHLFGKDDGREAVSENGRSARYVGCRLEAG